MAITSAAELSVPKPLYQREQTAPKSELDRDSFMKLLVAELKNQDPLEPMNARESITQLSQMTGVEKLTGIEKSLTELRAETAGLASTQISNLVGRTATADVTTLTVGATGTADGAFQLQNRAAETNIEIRNSAGDVVRTLHLGDVFPGAHNFTWDGNDEVGARVEAGRYSVGVVAKDASGNAITAGTTVSGMVTGVNYDNGLPELQLGSTRVLLGDVKSIAQ